MSIFSTILHKLGFGKDKPEEKPVAAAAPAHVAAPKPAVVAPVAPAPKPVAPVAAVQSTVGSPTIAPPPPAAPPVAPKPVAPAPISEVDVVKKLEELSVGKALDWKVSIVDLLKLLDMDSSYESRVELAKELGCPPELMHDSAKMNVWLHKTVLKKLAENGGNIPKDLLD
jgi:hypothetical protein